MSQQTKKQELIKALNQQKQLMENYVQADSIIENQTLTAKIHQYYLNCVERYPENQQEAIKQHYTRFVETLDKVKQGEMTLEDAMDEIKKSKDKQIASDDFQNVLKSAYVLGCLIFGAACLATIFSVGLPLLATSIALEGFIVAAACATACWTSLSSAFNTEPYLQKPHDEACESKTALLSFFKPKSPVTPHVSVDTANENETILNVYPGLEWGDDL